MTAVALPRYLDCLAVGDLAGALELATSLVEAGTPVGRVLEDVIRVAQIEVGRRWERNEWTVAQEHAATAVSEAVVDALLHGATVGDGGAASGRLVVACAEGEWHTMGARVMAGLGRAAGWEVIFLGPSVPSGQLARYLHDVGPDCVLVSCSVPLNLAGARRTIEAARETGTPVLAGGRGFGSDGSRAAVLGADAWAATAADGIEHLRELPRFTTPAPPLTHAGHVEHRAIERGYDQLVTAAMEALVERFPPAAEYAGERLDRTLEDLRFLFRFTSSALLVDEPELLDDYVRWLVDVLATRHLPSLVVPLTLDAAAAATAPDLPIATEWLRRQRSS